MLLHYLAFGFALGASQNLSPQAAEPPPLAPLAVLIGSWHATGAGFSTTLRYHWLEDGRILGVTNDVRATSGRLIARYHGTYLWDAGQRTMVFLTAASGGEVHRGRAWWRDGVLWHEADVSGGQVSHYASAVQPDSTGLAFFANYGSRTADSTLLQGDPLRYRRVGTAPPDWFLEDIRHLTRDGGGWEADNSAYRSAAEPTPAYRLYWTAGTTGHTMIGRLVSVDTTGGEHDVWDFVNYWDAERGHAVLYQVHQSGLVGMGTMVAGPDNTRELIQRFTAPDGASWMQRHVETREPDMHRSQSFERRGETWEARRSYVWHRMTGRPSTTPLAPGGAALRPRCDSTTDTLVMMISAPARASRAVGRVVRTRALATFEGQPVCRIVQVYPQTAAADVDTSILDQHTLAPVYYAAMVSGERQVFRFTPDRAFGQVIPADSTPRVVEHSAPSPFFLSPADDAVLAALDLAPGLNVQYTGYNPPRGFVSVTVRVVALDTITVRGAPVPAWRVTYDAGSAPATFWYSVQGHRMVRTRVLLRDGATFWRLPVGDSPPEA